MINKLKTLCVSGHRNVKEKIDLIKIKEIFNKFIEKGIDTFLVGMAVGFDTICFKVLEEIRREKDIKITACIPCPEQDKMFSQEQKIEYRRMVESADEKVILSQNYTPYCMMKRNRYMVDNACVLVAYLTENKGGTYSTVKYAKEKGLEIVIL